MQEKITALEAQLQEKEQLISALTERLEQAAEQLDRIHRTGGDRGLRAGGALPPELIEEHKALVEELHKAVEQWEDMQAEATLGRVEEQLGALRDLIASRVSDAAPMASSQQSGTLSEFMAQAAPAGSDRAADASEQDGSSGTDSRSYEAMKSSLLETEATTSQSPTSQAEGPDALIAEDIEPVDPPQSIDLTTADLEQLQEAIESRDSYIGYLIRRLRASESQSVPTGDWKNLENVPQELRDKLEEYESKLENMLRLAEVELSLERARLGREQAKLRVREHQIESERKRHGLLGEAANEQTGEQSPERNDSEASNRWLRMLGMGRNEEVNSDE